LIGVGRDKGGIPAGICPGQRPVFIPKKVVDISNNIFPITVLEKIFLRTRLDDGKEEHQEPQSIPHTPDTIIRAASSWGANTS
jgi:hypothetical protein